MSEEKPVEVEAPTSSTTAVPPAQKQVPVNGLAVAAMVVGIVAFTSGWVPFWGLLTGIAAVVLGVLGLKKATGKGLAITGIVTGGLAALTSIFFTLFFIIAITASGAAFDRTHDEAQRQAEQNQQMADSKKNYSKGDIANFYDLQVKVNSVDRNYVPDAGTYQIKEGKEYIVVNVTIKNISNSTQYISPYTFDINDGDKSNTNRSVIVDPEFSNALMAGDSATGDIVFELDTKDASNLKLEYKTRVYDSSDRWDEYVYTLAI